MSNEQVTVLAIKGLIHDLSPADKDKVAACTDKLRAMLKEDGECGVIAFALVGAEIAAHQAGGAR
jgi:hypothetical protein